MSFTEETLMAFADGELDEATRRAVEDAMRRDPDLAAQVARHQALRADVFGAFAPMLDEPVPERLLAAARPAPEQIGPQLRAPAANDSRWSWREWGALAAMLMVGVLVGRVSLDGGGDGERLADLGQRNGTLAAQGKLAEALSSQLASAPPADARVAIGVSFVGADGNYCRSFALKGGAGDLAGLACRKGEGWNIPVLAESQAGAGAYRTAAADVPPAVLEAIDQRIAGAPLDAAGELAAQRRGWQAK